MTIINRRHGFIFLKSYKTAGSSLELHFIRNTVLGNDIYYTTPDAQRYGLSNKRRHCVLRLFGISTYIDVPRFVRKRFTLKVSQHKSARHVKELVTPAFWDRALKVCGVRNPWELLLSYWRWSSRQDALDVPFEPWARAALSADPNQIKRMGSRDARELLHDFVFIDGRWIPDYTIRFEDLDGGIRNLSEMLGVDIPPLEIHEKRSQRINYRDYYSRSLARQVEEYYADMLEMTGYTFGNSSVTPSFQQPASVTTTKGDQ